MLHADRGYRLQYGNMADNSGAEEASSPLREIVRNRRVLLWTGGAVALTVVVGGIWRAHKRIRSPLLHEWFSHAPDWFMPLGFGIAALLALVILWKVPQWQVGRVQRLNAKERFDRVNEARKTLATILGGAAFLVGGFLTWQNLKVAQDAASTSQKALEVSREGQITDRFSKAIEQLGSEKLQIRLGGIYALEGIANESKELHWPIMEVLTAYVRENAPIKRECVASKEPKPTKPESAELADTPRSHPTGDIQAILTVLGRRDRRYEREGQYLDLTKTDLSGADLSEADLSGAVLKWACLYEADLYAADLHGTDLQFANLTGAGMSGGANLRGAYLSYAHLSKSDLGDADLSKADLTDADLSGAWAYAADFTEANLGGADLTAADLNNAHLRGAELQQTNLTGTHLNNAHLQGAQLQQAALTETQLDGADFREVDLSGTDLTNARDVTQQQINSAIGDSRTRLPKNMHAPDSWKK